MKSSERLSTVLAGAIIAGAFAAVACTDAASETPPDMTPSVGGAGGAGAGGTAGTVLGGGAGTDTGGTGVGGATGGGGAFATGGLGGSGSGSGGGGGSGSGFGGGSGNGGASGSANGGGAGQGDGGGGSGTAGSGGDAGGVAGAGNTGGSGAGTGGSGGAATGKGCGSADPLKSGRASISVGGTMREYILRVPDDYDAMRAHKLIFAFHAMGGTASQVAGGSNNDYYGLFSRSQGSAIFVSAEGIDAGWRNTGGRDVALVKAIIELLDSKLCIDKERIFSTGFSFGGMMSDAIGCAMADVFRAIAPMAGAIPNPDHLYSECNQPNMDPIAMWMAHGTSDNVVPIEDGKDALELFLARAGCSNQTMPVAPSPCVAYQGCSAGNPIHFCEWAGGHGVPSFAAQGIWDFFSQF